MKNLSLKIFAGLIAVVLWYFVTSEGNLTVVSFLAPIETRNLPDGRLIVRQSDKQAQVTIRGPAFMVAKIAAEPPRFRVSFPKVVEGRFVAPLTKGDLELPPYVQVVSVDPSEVEFSLDNLGEKELPVSVSKVGKIADGFEIKKLTVEPPQIKVKGPQTELNRLQAIETYPFDLQRVASSVDRTLNLRIPNSQIEPSLTQVVVKAVVGPLSVTRKFTPVSLELRAAPGEKLVLDTNNVTVEVSGSREMIQQLSVREIIPFARLTDEEQLPATLPIHVELPEGLQLVSVQPTLVKVSRQTSKR